MFFCMISYGMLDREEKVRKPSQRVDKLDEERSDQLKAAVKPKEVVGSSVYQVC